MVSVIVPVYNAASFLNRCVMSIVHQSLKDIEVILVDDGSVDESLLICKNWAQKDCRVKTIHQSNLGVTRARREGFLNSKGIYICFVDADDELENDALETMEKNIEGCDMVIGQTSFDGNFEWPYNLDQGLFNRIKAMSLLLGDKLHGGLWGRMFKRNLFDDFTFDLSRNVAWGEDLIMNLRLMKNANMIKVIPEKIYLYYQNPDGAGKTFYKSQTISYKKMLEYYVKLSINGVESLKFAMLRFILLNRMKILRFNIKKMLKK